MQATNLNSALNLLDSYTINRTEYKHIDLSVKGFQGSSAPLWKSVDSGWQARYQPHNKNGTTHKYILILIDQENHTRISVHLMSSHWTEAD